MTALAEPTFQPCYFASTGCTGLVTVPAGRSVGNLCPSCAEEFRAADRRLDSPPFAPVEPAYVAATTPGVSDVTEILTAHQTEHAHPAHLPPNPPAPEPKRPIVPDHPAHTPPAPVAPEHKPEHKR